MNGWLAEPFEQVGSGAEDSDILACRGNYRKGVCPIEPVIITICAGPGQMMTHWTVCAWTAAGEGYKSTKLAALRCYHIPNTQSFCSGRLLQFAIRSRENEVPAFTPTILYSYDLKGVR